MEQYSYYRTEQLIEKKSILIDKVVLCAKDIVNSRNKKDILELSNTLSNTVEQIKDIDNMLNRIECRETDAVSLLKMKLLS